MMKTEKSVRKRWTGTILQTKCIQTYYSAASEYTFSSTHKTISRIDHIIDHKSISKFKNIEIISAIFCNHNGMKLEIAKRRKDEKFTNMQKLNNIVLNNQLIKEEIGNDIRK